jgi:hypothetical protein
LITQEYSPTHPPSTRSSRGVRGTSGLHGSNGSSGGGSTARPLPPKGCDNRKSKAAVHSCWVHFTGACCVCGMCGVCVSVCVCVSLAPSLAHSH